jgi:hypothetical protein
MPAVDHRNTHEYPCDLNACRDETENEMLIARICYFVSALLMLSVSSIADANPEATSSAATRWPPIPKTNLAATLTWIRERFTSGHIQWSVSRDGTNWVAFEGPGESATLTFMAGNPADVNLPVGGLRYFWNGPGRPPEKPCLRVILRFTGVTKTELKEKSGAPITVVSAASSDGKAFLSKKPIFLTASLVELTGSTDKFGPAVERDAGCLDDSVGLLAAGQTKGTMVKVGLIVPDSELATQLTEAIRLAVHQSTSK